MRVRRFVFIAPLLTFWAGCTTETPVQEQETLFAVADEPSLALVRQISLKRLADQPELTRGVGGLEVRRAHIDELGEAHSRVRQTLNGVPVFGGEAIVHLGPDGSFKSMTDKLLRDIVVDTNPAYLDKEALEAAVDKMGGGHRLTGEPKTDLQILRHEDIDHLTYRVQLEILTADDEPSMPVVFVDAHTLDVVWSYENLKTSKNRLTYDGRTRATLPGTLKRSEGQAPISDAAVNQAHDNAGITYDYYFNNFGRDSYNGAGATIKSTVHHQRNYVNAFWNGTQMVYGDGNGVDSGPLTVLDVVGHELTHAVTEYESGLVYANESGALNEAMSDVFGAAIEAYNDNAVSADTWKIGEDCWTPGTAGDALRYMNDPATAGDKDYYPTRYVGTSDSGGVHTNSGIANLAFYLMVKGGTHPRGSTSNVVSALDAGNAFTSMMRGAAIFYRANTICLTPGATFGDARACTEQAATDLYGTTAAAAVSEAWQAVGVSPPPAWETLSTQAGLSGGTGSSTSFSQPTPTGATRMQFTTAGGTGDVDMYVRFGSAPTGTVYDCASESGTNNEVCTFDPSRVGTYYVLLKGYAAYSGVTYSVKYTR